MKVSGQAINVLEEEKCASLMEVSIKDSLSVTRQMETVSMKSTAIYSKSSRASLPMEVTEVALIILDSKICVAFSFKTETSSKVHSKTVDLMEKVRFSTKPQSERQFQELSTNKRNIKVCSRTAKEKAKAEWSGAMAPHSKEFGRMTNDMKER